MDDKTRRAFLYASTAVGANLLLAACRSDEGSALAASPAPGPSSPTDKGKPDEVEVAATEDLMREHGVLRRALVVYRESATRLRANPRLVSPAALQKTAKLFRAFGEDYHERKLEEAFIFPAIKAKSSGSVATLPDVLTRQHERGRAITDYVLSVTAAPSLAARAVEVAGVLDWFARMYEAHTADEDTILFPAWKKLFSTRELDELGDKFEDIEHATFGKDGFDDAVRQIGGIEAELGIADLAMFTAPEPPKV